MNPLLFQIKQKSSAIHFGMLRLCDDKTMDGMPVRIATAVKGDAIECVVEGEHLIELKDKTVKLVQKYKDDYIYITGKIDAGVELKNKYTVVSIFILKASWFTKMGGSAVSWLEEKLTYLRPQGVELHARRA